MTTKQALINFSDELNTSIPTLPNIIKVLKKQLLIVADNLNGDEPSGSGLKQIFTGKESEYKSDTAGIPQELDVYTDGADFSTYLSTTDHISFTVVKDCMCLITLGVMQGQSSGTKPDCTFFVNDIDVFTVEDPDNDVDSYNFGCNVIPLTQGDVIYFGSSTSNGYAVRCGQIDVINDMDGYVKPSFE